ncbi:MAG: hypothetical protein K0B11_04190 [Mariniphaga sp.]|nr:hypothetical protein [Mariniphaga sp.]
MDKIKTKILVIITVLAVMVLLLFALRPGKDKTESLVKLNASVTFDGEKFMVSNNDSLDYLSAEMTVNGYYKLTGMNLHTGETYTLWPVEFAHINGTHLPAKQIPQQFSIWCELSDGRNGFYSKKLKLKKQPGKNSRAALLNLNF